MQSIFRVDHLYLLHLRPIHLVSTVRPACFPSLPAIRGPFGAFAWCYRCGRARGCPTLFIPWTCACGPCEETGHASESWASRSPPKSGWGLCVGDRPASHGPPVRGRVLVHALEP